MHYYSYRYPCFGSFANSDWLVVFWATGIFDSDEFSDLVEAETSGKLIPAACIVIVRETIFSEVALSLCSNWTATSRLGPNTPLVLLGYGASGEIVKTEAIGKKQVSVSLNLADFQRAAITSIFAQRKGFVNATDLYHFENPSRRHSTKFIRLANLMTESSEIAFIAFCCLRYIPEAATVAYIDTPALHPIIFSIQEQRRSFSPATTLQAINFESYYNLNEFDFKYTAEAVAIISASTTGGLAQKLFESKAFELSQICQVLFLGSEPSRFHVVCDLMKDEVNFAGYESIEAVDALTCKPCKNHSVPIPIQSDQFTFAGPQTAPIIILEEHQHKESRSFLECAIGSGALKVGLGESIQSLGDHQYFVCLKSLLQTRAFCDRLNYILDRSFPARAHKIICAGDDSRELAEHVAARMKLDPVADLISIDQIVDIDIEIQKPLVVVADAVESGRSLQDISRRMRVHSKTVPVIYIVGVSKTSGERSREALKSTLTFADGHAPHIFETIHNVCLPQSSGTHPWIDERNLIATPGFVDCCVTGARAYFSDRLARLNRSSEPLLSDLFVPNRAGASLTFQPGFAFWKGMSLPDTHSSADVFFTIASVLQNVRAKGSSPNPVKIPTIRSNWLQQTVLDPENFNRFNDALIQASFLRAAHPRELNYSFSPDLSQKMLEIVEEAIISSTTDNNGSGAEFLLALAIGRLSLAPAQANRLVSLDDKSLPPIVRSLLGWLVKS